ncbi:MAG: DUF4147 domain-containing protein [Anaerolineaceae bacterium]|nr:DUF4147 domain-containing protein [Anaerolineaceae bacterium]
MNLSQLIEWQKEIIDAALDAANPVKSVEYLFSSGAVQDILLEKLMKKHYKRFHLISIGKAAVTMASGLINHYGDEINGGIIVPKSDFAYESELWHDRFIILPSSHPIPDQCSVEAANEIVHYLNLLDEDDFVYFLISGGGSALITLPEADIKLTEIMAMNQLLLACGATINEINCIRKHIDQVKGGKLIQKTLPAGFCTLILSDVIGDPVDVIASGPTVYDESTFEDALEILKKYQLREKAPDTILRYLENGLSGMVFETAKKSQSEINISAPYIIGGNKNSLNAAAVCAANLGMKVQILSETLVGEASLAANWVIRHASEVLQNDHNDHDIWCFLCGGETTVTIKGDGLGGRNLELALATVEPLSAIKNAFFVSFATDGEDGPTNAAGAWVTSETLNQALAMDLLPEQYLNRNDSYHFFEAIDQLIVTGSTGTNVNDICFLIIGE